MNRAKRTARKRHLRQTVNKVMLEGKEILPKSKEVKYSVYGATRKDRQFMLEVAATQKPYRIINPKAEYFKARVRIERFFV